MSLLMSSLVSFLRSSFVSPLVSRSSRHFLGSVSSRSGSIGSRLGISLGSSSIISNSVNRNSEETSNQSSNNLVHFIAFHKVTFKGSANPFAGYHTHRSEERRVGKE